MRGGAAGNTSPPTIRRKKRWSGRFIIVWEDGSWEFFRCCRCHQLLEDEKSRQRGLGADCAQRAPIDAVMSVKNEERARYRRWLREGSWVPPWRRARTPA